MSTNIRQLKDPVSGDVFYPQTDIAGLVSGGGPGIDATPTAGSVKPVQSGGALTAIKNNSIYDISVNNSDTAYVDLTAALGTNGANVPAAYRKGGMSVCYKQTVPATYNVAISESDIEPTGTVLNSPSSITNGIYIASQLADFSTLPSETGVANAEIYYYEDSGTYTVWTITMYTAESSEYVQYRLMKDIWSAAVSDWQGIDSTPIYGSKNAIESGAVERGLYMANHPYCEPEVIQTGADFNDYGTASATAGAVSIVKNADNSFFYRKSASSSGSVYIGLFNYDYTIRHYLYLDYILTKDEAFNLVVRTGKGTSDTTVGIIGITKGSGSVRIPLNKAYNGKYIVIANTTLDTGSTLTLSNIRLVKEDDTEMRSVINDLTVSSQSIDPLSKLSSVEITDYTVEDYGVNESGNYGTSTTYGHGVIPVVEGDRFILESHTNSLRYAFVTTDEYTSGGSIPVVPGTGVVTVPNNTTAVITAPEGATFLVFNPKAQYGTIIYRYLQPNDAPKSISNSAITAGGVARAIGKPTISFEQSWNYVVRAIIGTVTLRAGYTYKATATRTSTNKCYLYLCSGNVSSEGTKYITLSMDNTSPATTTATGTYTNNTGTDIVANIVTNGSNAITGLRLVVEESKNILLWTDQQTLSSDEKAQVISNLGLNDLINTSIENSYPVTIGDEYQYLTPDYWFADSNVSNGVIVGNSSSSHLRVKQITKGDVIHIHAEQTGSASDSGVVLYYSSVKPVIGTANIRTIAYKSIGNNNPVVDIYWVADADGWIIVRSFLRDIIKFSMYKKVMYDALETYLPENTYPSVTTGRAIISDPDAANYGEVITTASTSYGVTDFIDISGAVYVGFSDRIVATSWAESSITGHVFYDVNKEPIQTISNIEGETPGASSSKWGYYLVPSNAVYARFTLYNGSRLSLLKMSLDNVGVSNSDIYKERIAQAKFTGSADGMLPALGLMHFSDFHEDTVAGNLLMNYIRKCESYIDDVICTGDVVRDYLSNGSPAKYFTVTGLAERALFVLGNHDQAYSSEYYRRHSYFWCDGGANGDGVIDTTIAKSEAIKPTHSFSYNRYFKDFISGWGVTMPTTATGYDDDDSTSPYYQACYWHKDYAAQKIRLIGIDCMYRFDGILAKDEITGDFIKDGNGMLTIATDGEGYAKLTTEQETWLYDLLMDTLDENSDAHGYSVAIICHYPLDDLDGQCTIVDKVNTGDGTVVNHRTGDNVLFCGNIESASSTLDTSFNMRNRVQNSTQVGFAKGNVNNIGDIVQHFVDSNGKFVAWICGHTHYDFFYYPERYPDILCVVIDQTGNLRTHNSNARPDDMDSRLCANYYAIDTVNHWFKIVRLGLTQGKNMREKKYLCYDYVNRKVISEG